MARQSAAERAKACDYWVNRSKVIRRKVEHPCRKLKYCPYGAMVELFPIDSPKRRTNMSCKVFGHNCPIHYNIEDKFEE